MWKQFLSKLPPRRSSKSDTNSSSAAAAGKRFSVAVSPTSSTPTTAAFHDVPSFEWPSLFVDKINLCCSVTPDDDVTVPAKIHLKRATLSELADFAAGAAATSSFKFTEKMVDAASKLFAADLFRSFPPVKRESDDESEPIFDPAWPHLQLVYDLLVKFISSPSLDAKLSKSYFDQSFIAQLLELFDSEDPRERECLKAILHRIYGKFMAHRAFIRKSVSNTFYRFVFETEKHNGIAELLEVFGSVITGFALPLKEEHKLFLWRTLIPLHKPRIVGAYMQQLTYCVIQFIEKEPALASTVIMGLLKYWPVTNSQKEVMFLGELEEVLESTNMGEFQKCMVPLFRRIGCSLNSSHFQVAERALFLWHNDHLISLIAQNREVIIPLIVPALERNSRSHWNKAVLNVTLNVKKMFSDMDEELFTACQNKFIEEEEARSAMAEKRRMIWERLETAAFQPMIENASFLTNHVVTAPFATATFA